ncbi:phytanoyl-CoA dioxygenase family protein [Spirosoma foliorum]|uniref:phytanoyl-CoA dioxygenase family protein n=1 Tax=Spirosoma foliorum TaxID=2710596 RepID=UPI001C70EE16
MLSALRLSIAANAGDFIIWHQALPHGSSPNRSREPRFVQYINYAPSNIEVNPDWQ